MKFGAHADLDDYSKSIKIGALKGGSLGLGIGSALGLYLKKKTNYFSGKVGGFERVFIFVAPAAFCAMVNMELSSRDFEEHHRKKLHGENLKPVEPVSDKHKNADQYNRAIDWLGANKYKVIVGGWAASMAGSFHLVNRDKYLTKAQKIVQARVYAQGLTVAMLLASVFFSVTETKDNNQKAVEASKSWQRDIAYVETANHPHGLYASDEQRKEALEQDKTLHEEKRQEA